MRAPGAVGRRQRAQQPFDAAQVLPDVLAQQLRRLGLELDRRVAEMVLQPGLAISRTVDRDVDDLPAAVTALTSGAGTVPPPPTRIRTVDGQRDP